MKDFIPYQEALALKELGFDEPCICAFYQDGQTTDPFPTFEVIKDVINSKIAFGTIKCTRPTYSQAFRWFREKYKLYHDIKMFGDWDKPQYSYYVSGRTMNNQAHMWHYEDVNSYSEAELACLRKLIEIVKNKEK